MCGSDESAGTTGEDFMGEEMAGAELLRGWGRDGLNFESLWAVIAAVTLAGGGDALGFSGVWWRWESGDVVDFAAVATLGLGRGGGDDAGSVGAALEGPFLWGFA
jgi:hypothetical protein